jgi:hypothetical protein
VFNGDWPDSVATDPKKVMMIAEKFTANWNCKNLRMTVRTLRPQRIDWTMEEKLSSSKTISQAFIAICVPLIPMANPTSASFNAGASFVPYICDKLF